METLVLHPESTEQLKTIKAVLKALKVPFEAKPAELPESVAKSMAKGISQYEAGQSISFDEFTKKHFSKK